MKIYVAGSVKDIQRVSRIAEALEHWGDTITFKWWGPEGDVGGWTEEDPERSDELGRQLAEMERAAVRSAEAHVLVWSSLVHGALLETGMAMEREIPIFVLDPQRESPFWHFREVRVCRSEQDLLGRVCSFRKKSVAKIPYPWLGSPPQRIA